MKSKAPLTAPPPMSTDDKSASALATIVDADDKNPLLYYTALVRIKTAEEGAKTTYSLLTRPLTPEEKEACLANEDELKKALNDEILELLQKLKTTPSQLEKNLSKKNFPNKPVREFKFAEKYVVGAFEDTDLVASTPHRLMQFFNADFIPGSIYVWLFMGFVIGAILVNTARLFSGILNLRKSVEKQEQEAEGGEVGIEVCNSTICLGNPIPIKKVSTLEKVGLWANAIFKFVYSASFYYWVLWSVASAIYGIGLATVPFSIPIAIAIPLVLACVQNFGDPVLNYIWGKKTKISVEDKLSFDMLAKLKLLEEGVAPKDQKSLKGHLDYIYDTVKRSPGKSASLITKPSLWTQRGRLATNILIGFGSGCVMTTLIFFATLPFIGTGLASVLLPFITALVMGIIYAIKAYRDTTRQSSLHDESFKMLRQDYEQLRGQNQEELTDTLNRFYQIVLDLRQEMKDKSFACKTTLPAFAAAIDNPDFLLKSRRSPEGWDGWRSRSWQRFKQLTHRLVILIGGTESGSLVFRTVFSLVGGLTALGLATNPLSLTAIGIIMLFIAIGWGTAKLCQFYAQKYIEKEKMFLEQSQIYIRSLSLEHSYLESKRTGLDERIAAIRRQQPATDAAAETEDEMAHLVGGFTANEQEASSLADTHFATGSVELDRSDQEAGSPANTRSGTSSTSTNPARRTPSSDHRPESAAPDPMPAVASQASGHPAHPPEISLDKEKEEGDSAPHARPAAVDTHFSAPSVGITATSSHSLADSSPKAIPEVAAEANGQAADSSKASLSKTEEGEGDEGDEGPHLSAHK